MQKKSNLLRINFVINLWIICLIFVVVFSIVFCGDPPLVPNAQSNLHRHQKHFVFPIGQEANYECEQGFRPINDGIAQTRCTIDGIHLPSAGHVLFPDVFNADHSNSPNIRRNGSNRSKNSKRLSDVDDEEQVKM